MLLGLALVGCSANHVVAGDENALPLDTGARSWCSAACETMKQCTQSLACACDENTCTCPPSYTDTCPADCASALSPYIGGDDFCVGVALRLKRCVDANSCSPGLASSSCAPTAAEQAACDSNAPTPDQPAPIVGTGLVRCSASDGGGSSAPSTDGTIVCQEDRGQCTDGHTYGWICQIGPSSRSCSCSRDSKPSGSFDPGPSCPTLAAVNGGCGFDLQDSRATRSAPAPSRAGA